MTAPFKDIGDGYVEFATGYRTRRLFVDMGALDPANPLVFHEVTGQAQRSAGITLSDLLKANAVLAPPALRARHPTHSTLRKGWAVIPADRRHQMEWSECGLLGGIDRMAGDDGLIFFDAGWSRALGHRPAFGFLLRDLVAWGGRRIGLRAGDLLSTYSCVEAQFLEGLAKTDPVLHDRFRNSVRALDAHEPLRAVLRAVAAAGTSQDAVLPLARAFLIGLTTGEPQYDRMWHLLPEGAMAEHPKTPSGPDPAAWAKWFGLSRVARAWVHLLTDPATYRAHPEVVASCPIPVRLACYVHESDRWARNPYYRPPGVLP